jgi:hypothetical protein
MDVGKEERQIQFFYLVKANNGTVHFNKVVYACLHACNIECEMQKTNISVSSSVTEIEGT